jgi:HSP20 family protein
MQTGGPTSAFGNTTAWEKIMKIARFEPWSYVDFFNQDLKPFATDYAVNQWVPAVDIIEEKSRFVVHADVPGVRAEDIEVTMDAGVLTVTGIRHALTRDEDADLRRSERASGRFSRRFTLPESTDAEKITARSHDGILEISIPKQPEVQPRQIAVEAA